MLDSANQFKLLLVQSAVLLSGYDLSSPPKSKCIGKFVKKLGYEELPKNVSAKSETFGSSNFDTLNLVNFVDLIRREIIDKNIKEDMSQEEQNSRRELSNIFLLFQLALVSNDPDECTVVHLHTPAFRSFLYKLIADVEKNSTDIEEVRDFTREEENQLSELLGISLFGKSNNEVKKAYHNFMRVNHPDKKPNDKEAEENVKTLTTLYTKFVDSRPKVVTKDQKEMLNALQMNLLWLQCYRNQKSNAERRNNFLNFDKTLKIYSDLLGSTVDSDVLSVEYIKNHKNLENKVWYQNKLFFAITFVNIAAIYTIVVVPQNLSLVGASNYLKSGECSLLGFAIPFSLYLCATSYHTLTKHSIELTSDMDFMMCLGSTAISAIPLFAYVSEAWKHKEIPLGLQIIGLAIAFDAALVYSCYKKSCGNSLNSDDINRKISQASLD